MLYILGLLLVAGALYVAYNSYTSAGFDWRKGVYALIALLAGLVAMAGDWLGTFSK